MEKAANYFARASWLRCPVCGKSPIFLPVAKVRRLSDWFEPLDGCPRCGYAYDREPGYFLMAIWVFNYGCGSLLGLVLYVVLEWNFDLPLPNLLAAVLIPVLAFNLLFARHSKAYFIAMDHLFDPHERGGDDDRGNRPVGPAPVQPAPPAGRPDVPGPCETQAGVR